MYIVVEIRVFEGSFLKRCFGLQSSYNLQDLYTFSHLSV